MTHSSENPVTEAFGDGAEGWHAGGAASGDSITNQGVEVLRPRLNGASTIPWAGHASKLLTLGFIPVPVRGKAPMGAGWQNTTRENALERFEHHAATGVGVLTQGLAIIDVDVRDPGLAEDVHDWIQKRIFNSGPMPLRYGSRPKFAVICAAECADTKKVESDVFRDAQGQKSCIEILGDGQQLVFYGAHPGTGKPYQWPQGCPVSLELATCELEVLSADVRRKLLEYFRTRALERGLSLVSSGTSGTHNGDGGPTFPVAGLTLDIAREALSHLSSDDLSYKEWLDVGMALHQQEAGNTDWYALWDEWSATSAKYPGQGGKDGTYTKWQSFHADKPGGITMRSILRQAEDNGWRRPESVEGARLEAGGDEYPDLTHDGLALDLGRNWGWNDRARYVATWGKWMFWTGTRWEPDERRVCMTEVRDFLRGVANDLERWAAQRALRQNNADDADKIRNRAAREAKLLRQAPTHAAVESTARSNRELAASAGQWDGDLDLLGTPAGVLELQTGTLRPARREDYITKHTAVGPADGEPRLWLQFLHTAMQGDTEMVGFLQRLCGYTLTGHTREHKLPFLFGPGGNGKSVFANTLHAILKDYAARAPAEAFLSSRGERHPTDLAGMQGARLVVGSELPAGRAWNESAIKDLTGGDPITARFMRQDFFTYNPQFTLLIVGNHQPSIGAVDDAMRRRVLLIPFTAKIPKDQRDRRLEEKLRVEHGGILRWMAEGAVQWYAHGLQVPQTVLDATEDYLEAEDVLGQFIAEALEADPHKEVPSTELFDQYSTWCVRQNARPMSQRALTQALKERGFTVRKTSGARVFEGYRLVPGTDAGVSWVCRGVA